MTPTITDWVQAGASLSMMLAAFAAAWIAAKAPKSAARWAEDFRLQSEAATEKQKLRMFVFVSLMKCRAQILHPDAIAALNLIDVAFSDREDVRISYKSFVEATSQTPVQPERIIERYHVIIEKVARSIGFDQISVFDIRAGYYPSALGRLDEAALADAEEKIARRQLAAEN